MEMVIAMGGILDDLDQAEVFENSDFFAAGRYIVRIEACKFILKGHKGDSFVVEATVLGVIAEDGEVKQKDGSMEMVNYPRVGVRAAQIWGASGTEQRIKQGRGTWIAFLCSAFGVKKARFTGPEWKSHSGAVLDGHLNGQIFGLDCHMVRTKEDGPFTVHNWRGPQTPAQLAEFGLAADGSPLVAPA